MHFCEKGVKGKKRGRKQRCHKRTVRQGVELPKWKQWGGGEMEKKIVDGNKMRRAQRLKTTGK